MNLKLRPKKAAQGPAKPRVRLGEEPLNKPVVDEAVREIAPSEDERAHKITFGSNDEWFAQRQAQQRAQNAPSGSRSKSPTVTAPDRPPQLDLVTISAQELDAMPEEPTAESYEQVSVEDFGKAILRGLASTNPTQSSVNGASNDPKHKKRSMYAGIGAPESAIGPGRRELQLMDIPLKPVPKKPKQS